MQTQPYQTNRTPIFEARVVFCKHILVSETISIDTGQNSCHQLLCPYFTKSTGEQNVFFRGHNNVVITISYNFKVLLQFSKPKR